MVSDQPVLGVLGCPNLPLKLAEPNGPKGCLLVAVKGHGAFMAALTDGAPETPVHCSQETDPSVRLFGYQCCNAHCDYIITATGAHHKRRVGPLVC